MPIIFEGNITKVKRNKLYKTHVIYIMKFEFNFNKRILF